MGFFSSAFKSIGDIVSDPFGTQASVKALREAGRIEEADALENKMLAERVLKIGEPFRERADIAGRELLDIAQAPIGGPEFQRDLTEALAAQRFSLAGFGLGTGTTAERAAGETTSRALARERDRRVDILSFLSGGAETGIPGAISARGLASQSELARAQTAVGVGQAKVAGRQSLIDLITTGGAIAAFA